MNSQNSKKKKPPDNKKWANKDLIKLNKKWDKDLNRHCPKQKGNIGMVLPNNN